MDVVVIVVVAFTFVLLPSRSRQQGHAGSKTFLQQNFECVTGDAG